MRRIHASAARGRTTGKAERAALYRRLLRVADASLEQAAQVQRLLRSRTSRAARRLRAELAHFQPLVQQVIAQTQRRVLQAEQVPASDKLVSLFEPHTAVIRRGNLAVDAEFGRKLLLDEVDGGLLTRYAVLDGNPPDAPQLKDSLAHHIAQFAHPPGVLAADRGFHTAANERRATEAGVRCVALPKPGGQSAARRAWERRPAFRRAHRFRAGVEGRISLLKRRFGLRRCRYHGQSGMERWVGWGILAHNLRQISQTLVARRPA
jgi:IS5 family transposase